MTPEAEELRMRLESAGVRVPLSGLLRASQVALVLDKTPRTLQNWRVAGTGPKAVRLNGQWSYSLESLAAWIGGEA